MILWGLKKNKKKIFDVNGVRILDLHFHKIIAYGMIFNAVEAIECLGIY